MADSIVADINNIGGKIREMKAAKADKAAVQVEVDKLLAAKKAYKTLTGEDFQPTAGAASTVATKKGDDSKKIEADMETIGAKIRDMKAAKADKAAIQTEVDKLLAAKAAFKQETGQDYKAPAAAPAAPAGKKGGDAKKTDDAKPPAAAAPDDVPKGLYFLPETSAGDANKKCCLVAELCKSPLQAFPATAAEQSALVARQAPALPALWDNTGNTATGRLIFGATAVCKYLAAAAKLADTKSCVPLDELLELEDRVLARATADKKTHEGLVTALQTVEASPFFATSALATHTMYHSLTAALGYTGGAKTASSVYPTLASALAKVSTSAALKSAEAAAASLSSAPKLGSKKAQKAAAKAQKADDAPAVGGNFSTADVVKPQLDLSNWEQLGVLAALRVVFTAAIGAAFPEAAAMTAGENVGAVSRCAQAQHGDYQCNNALALSKALKALNAAGSYSGAVAPRDIAARIIAGIPADASVLIGSCTAAPNGFINISISSDALVRTVSGIASQGARPPSLPQRKVLVDFSSPNIAKEMHVGHLRSTIIGDCVCRIFEFIGYEVMRVNHVGDWGTQFGMLITYLQEAFPDILTNPPNISDLTAIYKASKKRFDEDEKFKETARLNVVKLQSGDAACRAIWQLLCDISRAEFKKVYDVLDVRLEEFGESFYNPMIPGCIEDLKKAGLVIEEEKMLIIKLPHFTIPLIVQKSDGGYGYDSTDCAALQYRLKELQRDWIVYITDAGQAPHFHMVFDAGRAAGWMPESSAAAAGAAEGVRVDHIGFGVVSGDDGKRLKTRSGETVKLIDLLDEAPRRMEEVLLERAKEGKTPLSPEEIKVAAKSIGYAAVKYADLKNHPTTNYIFSYDRMLDTKGDTAVYLMFAYARLCSILAKAKIGIGANSSGAAVDVAQLKPAASSLCRLAHPAERALALELLQLGDVLRSVALELMPNRLCDYLKDLSVKCTDFVTKCHVLNALQADGTSVDVDTVKARLLLCESTRAVMDQCLKLLGISPLDRI